MIRSLRNLALLGLLVLGASSAGAAEPVLININYNAATRELKFTPTNNAPGVQLPAGTTFWVPSGNGLLFENFFTGTHTVLGGGALASVSPTIGGRLIGYSGTGWSNPSDSFNAPFNEGVTNGTGLMLLSFAGGDLKFSRDQPAFASGDGNSLTITFTSDNAQPFATTAFTGSINLLGEIRNQNGDVVSEPSWDVGYYSYTYSAVPEPSTYAAIAGALGLAYAVYRRRQAAAAATA
jgi:hypothetical protein